MEKATNCFQSHAGGIRLPVGRITGYVRRPQKDGLQQLTVYIGLMLPSIDNRIAYLPCFLGTQQCRSVNDLSATSIYYHRAALQRGKKRSIRQMESLIHPRAI